jgi:hypothetical protein
MQLLLYEYRRHLILKIWNENWADIVIRKMEEQAV